MRLGLLLTVAFVSGLAGATIARVTMTRRLGPFSAFINGPQTVADAHEIAARLTRDLDLTPDQERQIDTVITRRMVEVGAVREQLNAQLLTIIRGGQTEIDSILTPSQRAKFLEMRRRKGLVDSAGRPVLVPLPH